MPSQRGGPEGREGTILLPVLLLLLLLATAATAMTLQARTSLREAATRRDRLSLQLAADAAVRAVALALSTASANRAVPPFAVDGTSQVCRLADGRRLALNVQDEGGRVDLNKATSDLLRKILGAAGMTGPEAQGLIEAITARRDRGVSATRGGKLEARLAKTYATPSGGFGLADALDQLPGVDDSLFERLRPLFMVANGSAGIDPVVASPGIRAIIPSRELASPAFEPMTTPSNHSDFTITATVAFDDGASFQRQALLHLDPESGPLGRFTSWEAPDARDAIGGAGLFCRRIAAALAPG